MGLGPPDRQPAASLLSPDELIAELNAVSWGDLPIGKTIGLLQAMRTAQEKARLMLRQLGQEIGAGAPTSRTTTLPPRRPAPVEPGDDDEQPPDEPAGREVAPGRFMAPHPLMVTSDSPDPSAPLPAYHPRMSGSMDMAASAPGDEARITRTRNLADIFN